MPHILIVDDDDHIREVIAFALNKAGHSHVSASNGQQALDMITAGSFDLIILDVGLPEMDGLEVCRQVRRNLDVPILFLSARDEEIDRILGLEIGGDDYVTKPFSPRELIARIGVILRRVNGKVDQENDGGGTMTRGLIVLDPIHHSVRVNATDVALTAIEFNMLKSMMVRPRMAFTREQIMAAAYPQNIHVSDRTIDSHVRNIRGKFKAVGCEDVIETVHGIGFRLGACGPARDDPR